MKLIYISSPYSKVDKPMRTYRAAKVSEFTMWCIKTFPETNFYCPIAHSHMLAEYGDPGLDENWDFWKPIDKDWIKRCDEVWVLALDGYKQSVGVKQEVKWAAEMGKPVGGYHYSPSHRPHQPWVKSHFDFCRIFGVVPNAVH